MRSFLKVKTILFLFVSFLFLMGCEDRVEMAKKYWADGKHQEAIKKLSKEQSNNPNNLKARTLMQKYTSELSLKKARKLIELKNYDLAINLLEREVQDYPTVNEFFYLLGNCYTNKFYDSNNKGYKEKAIKYYKSSIQINDNHFPSLFNLALLSKEKNDWERLAAHHDNPDVLRNLGRISKNYDMIKKSLALVPVESDYYRIDYKEKTKTGTFIVKKDQVVIYNMNGLESDKFNKYDVFSYVKKDKNRLFFHIKEPVKKIGWVGIKYMFNTSGLESFNIWKRKPQVFGLKIYVTKREAELRKGRHFLVDGPFNVGKVIFYGNETYRGKNFIKDSIKPMKEEDTSCGKRGGGRRWCGPLLKVSFLYIEPVSKYVNKDDAEIGKGSIKMDKERAMLIKNFVQKLGINKEFEEKLLAGHIARNYLETMVLASMGKPKKRKKVVNDDGLLEEFVYDSDISLFLKNGRLVSWKL